MKRLVFLILLFFCFASQAEEKKENVEIPTLTHTFKYGDIITSDDIAMKSFPEKRIGSNVIISEDDLIGKTPKRSVSANRPIRRDEITTQALIEKGATVSMNYKSETMQVSATGESLERGSLGDNIKVKNIKSGAIVSGTVAGRNLVNIAPLGNH